MKRFLKVFSLIFLVVLVAVVFGTQVVRVLRAVAAPEPLPYGLTVQNTGASA